MRKNAVILIIIILVLSLLCCALSLLPRLADFFDNSIDRGLYPLEYCDYVEKYSAEYGVDEALIYAVIKCESGFDKDSLSPSGAVGLMQIMPGTMTDICERLGEEHLPEELYEPELNIRLGVWYIAYLIRYFGNTELAVAAYNAGMGNVSSWLKDTRYSANGEKLDKIPFSETEKYLEKVLNAMGEYNKILNEKD